MRKVVYVLAGLMLLVSLPVTASATTISLDFDTPDTGSDLDEPGITFSHVLVASHSYAVSAPNLLAVDSTGTGTIQFDFDVEELTFNAGSFSSKFDAEAYDIDGKLVDSFSKTLVANLNDNPLQSLSGSGIRKFVFHDGGYSVAIDNLSITHSPEPVSILIFGMGLAGLGGAAYRKRKHR